jgi:hyperosmotically inducible protein
MAVLAAGCDPDGRDAVPKVKARAEAHAEAATPGGQLANPDGNAARLPESTQDAALSSKVEAALGAEPELHGSSIVVRSREGVVTLSGITPDPTLRSMAAHVALSIHGVKLVRNEIALAQAT